MGKVPYTKISKKEAKGLGKISPTIRRGPCGTIHSDNLDLSPTIRLAMEDLNRNYRAQVNPEDCADGSCPPVYIPIIIHFSEFSDDNNTQYGVNQASRLMKYNDIIQDIAQINRAFAGDYVGDYGGTSAEKRNFEFLRNSQVNDFSSEDHLWGSSGKERWQTPTKYIGYYTGAQIYDEDTQEMVDEFVSHRELREIYPNIRFFLPTQIKTSHIIDGLFIEKTGCKVNLLDVMDVIGVPAGNEARELLQEDYLYFAKDLSGALYYDGEILTQSFFTKLNVIQQIVNGNATPLDVSSRIIGSSLGSAVEGVDFDRIMNHQGGLNTVFTNFALLYNASSYVAQDTWSATINPYGNNTWNIKGGNDLPSRFFFHEFGHILGRDHAWLVPTIAGTNSTEFYGALTTLNGDIDLAKADFPGEHTIWGKTTINETVFNSSILNHNLKPPFNYEVENLKYKAIKRDSDKADEDYEYWSSQALDRFESSVSGPTTQEIVQSYLERKNLLNAKLASTSQINTGDFISISEEEKGYLEFLYLRFLPHVTNNFTVNVTFTNGDLDTTKAQVQYNGDYTIPEFHDEQENTTGYTDVSAFLEVLNDIAIGVSSFWGGSYTLKNFPAVGSIYNGDVIAIGAPIEQRYMYVATSIPGNYNWAQAVALAEAADEGWELPSPEVAVSIITEINNYYTGTSQIDLLSAIEMEMDYETMPVWTGESVSATTATQVQVVAGVNPNLSAFPTFSIITASVILVKQIDLLEDDTIATQLVVNPTNDDGTRKGPNINTYIPFCDRADNTKYDPFWMHNFNAYNPAYPVYPDNTPVENLLAEEFCPCLHTTQTFLNGDNTIYDYKIIGGGDNAWAAHTQIPGNSASDILNEFRNMWTDLSNPLDISIIDRPSTTHDFRDKKAGQLVNSWLIYTTNRYKDGYDSINSFSNTSNSRITSVALYKYNDPEQTVLSLPFFNGYCGFGWGTVLPVVYKIDNLRYSELKYLQDNTYEELSDFQQIAVDSPAEFNIIPSPYNFEAELRLGAGLGISAGIGNRISTATNIQPRYGIGSVDANSNLYNPLRQHFNDTIGHTMWLNVSGGINTPLFDLTPRFDYYEDLYGEYNPFNLNDSMMYSGVSITDMERTMPRDYIKRVNYLVNQDKELNTNFNIIYTEDSIDSQNPDNREESDFEVIWTTIAQYISNFSIAGAVGGCDDVNALNYNPDVTYNNGTCIERVFGCFQEWAENYLIDSAGEPNENINTDDGSCYTTLCNNPLAIGDYGGGYNQDLINLVQEYSNQYSTQALIEAADLLVGDLDVEDYSVCQFTAIPRNTIIKLVCIPRDELANLTVCNSNPMITYIKDADTGDMYNYTSNPVVESKPLLDLLKINSDDSDTFDNGIQKLLLLNSAQSGNYINYSYNGDSGIFHTIRTNMDTSFPSPIEGETIDEAPQSGSEVNKLLLVEVFGESLLDLFQSMYYYTHIQTQYNWGRIVYNCIENPILADGSGGCALYSPNGDGNDNDLEVKLSACSLAEIQSTTPYDCDNQILFNPEETGGYILDISIFNSDEQLQNLNPCTNSVGVEQKYIIGGELASSYGTISEANGAVVTYNNLPAYSSSQINELAGYPTDILIQSLLPIGRESRGVSLQRDYTTGLGNIITSSVLQTNFSEYFYTKEGVSYSGFYIIQFNIESIEITFRIYTDQSSIGEELYTRNTILQNSDIKPTKEEAMSKKIGKVINKIINLPIFTDN